MLEVHSIRFDRQEVIAAVLEHHASKIAPIPADDAVSIDYRIDQNGKVTAHLNIMRDPRTQDALIFDSVDLTVALVKYCMTRGVPIKKASDKWVGLVDSGLALFVVSSPSTPRP